MKWFVKLFFASLIVFSSICIVNADEATAEVEGAVNSGNNSQVV